MQMEMFGLSETEIEDMKRRRAGPKRAAGPMSVRCRLLRRHVDMRRRWMGALVHHIRQFHL